MMGLSDKIKNAKSAPSMFDEIPAERMFALKMQSKIALAIMNSRKQLGMSQSEFAAYCGVSQPMISKWESGECSFTFKKFTELADRLGWNVRLEIERPQEKRAILVNKKHDWSSAGNAETGKVVQFPGSYRASKEN